MGDAWLTGESLGCTTFALRFRRRRERPNYQRQPADGLNADPAPNTHLGFALGWPNGPE
jgi:hypothetical protein